MYVHKCVRLLCRLFTYVHNVFSSIFLGFSCVCSFCFLSLFVSFTFCRSNAPHKSFLRCERATVEIHTHRFNCVLPFSWSLFLWEYERKKKHVQTISLTKKLCAHPTHSRAKEKLVRLKWGAGNVLVAVGPMFVYICIENIKIYMPLIRLETSQCNKQRAVLPSTAECLKIMHLHWLT